MAQPTRKLMRNDVAEYIKNYNLERLHSANGDQSPIEYEVQEVKNALAAYA